MFDFGKLGDLSKMAGQAKEIQAQAERFQKQQLQLLEKISKQLDEVLTILKKKQGGPYCPPAMGKIKYIFRSPLPWLMGSPINVYNALCLFTIAQETFFENAFNFKIALIYQRNKEYKRRYWLCS